MGFNIIRWCIFGYIAQTNKYMSKHFSLSEMKNSDTAIKLNISNEPTTVEYGSMTKLINNVLEPLRQYLKRPIIITSGYRSKILNKAIKGAPNSQHMKGQAADLVFRGMYDAYIWVVDNLDYDQVIWEQSSTREWIHVSYVSGSKNRHESLIYKNGNYEYFD